MEVDVVKRLAEVAAIIKFEEERINENEKIYLATWSPDPKQLPDCSFYMQHKWCVPYVQTYLQACQNGVACVESTQIGYPHYHMWYQTSDNCYNEEARIRWVKVLSKIGNIKITTAKYIIVNGWKPTRNALYYYKEDLAGQQLHIRFNPITQSMVPPQIDYSDYTYMFSTRQKQTARKYIEKASQVKELEEFYKKSF